MTEGGNDRRAHIDHGETHRRRTPTARHDDEFGASHLRMLEGVLMMINGRAWRGMRKLLTEFWQTERSSDLYPKSVWRGTAWSSRRGSRRHGHVSRISRSDRTRAACDLFWMASSVVGSVAAGVVDVEVVEAAGRAVAPERGGIELKPARSSNSSRAPRSVLGQRLLDAVGAEAPRPCRARRSAPRRSNRRDPRRHRRRPPDGPPGP